MHYKDFNNFENVCYGDIMYNLTFIVMYISLVNKNMRINMRIIHADLTDFVNEVKMLL